MMGRHGHGGPPATGSDQSAGIIPLTQVQAGQEVTLARVDAGRGLCYRLAEMGLTPGAAFWVLQPGRPGPFIVAVRGARLVLGYGMVHRIHVRPQQRSCNVR